MFHTWIEFGNRLVTVAITLVARGGVRRRVAVPPPVAAGRRDLVWLAAVQPARDRRPGPCSAASWC